MKNTGEPKIIIGLGPWSSGSTAITGYLDRLGAWTCPPHQMTNDPLTPNSHEPKYFRDLLCSVFDETTLKQIQSIESFESHFEKWIVDEKLKATKNGCASIFLKHPLSVFVLPQIVKICDPQVYVFLRPLRDIERSRKRRGWHPVYGIAGAQKIYSTIFSTTVNQSIPFCAVSYKNFLNDQMYRRDISRRMELNPTEKQLANAESWLRKPD